MKKKLSLFLAVLMVMSTALSGCGSTGKNTENSESKVSSEATKDSGTAAVSSQTSEAAPELEEATIQMMIIGPGPQEDTEKVVDAFNELLKDYVPNTTVELNVVLAGEYKDSLNRVLASEEAVDLAWVGYASNLAQDQIDGNLMPLDDLLAEYGQGIVEELGADVLDMHRAADGELYYTFSWQGLFGNKRGMYFAKEMVDLTETVYPGWLEETRKIVDTYWNEETTPENLDLFYDQLEKYYEVSKANGKLYAGHTTANNSYQFSFVNGAEVYIPMNNGVGVGHNDETFTVVDTYQSEFIKTYLRRVSSFYEKGYMREDIVSASGFKRVQGGAWDDLCTTWYVHNMWTDEEYKKYEQEWGVEVVTVPIDRNGSITSGKATGMAIPYCADEPERAMMVLNALYTVPELYQLLVYGIEGEHYTSNSDGTITHVGMNSADSPYGLANWFVGTCKNSLPLSEEEKQQYATYEELEKTAYTNPFLSFSFNATNVSDAVAALKAVDTEYWNVLRTGGMGDEWEEHYNAWIDARKAAGVDKVIAEYQKQLNEYIEKNNITGLWW